MDNVLYGVNPIRMFGGGRHTIVGNTIITSNRSPLTTGTDEGRAIVHGRQIARPANSGTTAFTATTVTDDSATPWDGNQARMCTGYIVAVSTASGPSGDAMEYWGILDGVADDTITVNEWRTVRSTLVTSLAGANNDLVFKAVSTTVASGLLCVEYVDPDEANAFLDIAVDGNKITVNLATGAGKEITSTAEDIRLAVNAHVEAGALVQAEAVDGEDGVVTAMAEKYLTSGNVVVNPSEMDGKHIQACDFAKENYIAYNIVDGSRANYGINEDFAPTNLNNRIDWNIWTRPRVFMGNIGYRLHPGTMPKTLAALQARWAAWDDSNSDNEANSIEVDSIDYVDFDGGDFRVK